MPDSPWIGSTSTATMLWLLRAMLASSRGSPKRARTKPLTSGSKPACTLRLPVAESVASVRPWKECSITIDRGLVDVLPWPYMRAILIAHSLASAPELPKNTLSMPLSATRRSASFALARDAVDVGRVQQAPRPAPGWRA